MTTQLVRGATTVVLGLASGLGVVLVWSALNDPPSDVGNRLTTLEHQLARMEAGLGGPSEPMPDEPPSPLEAALIEAQSLALWSSQLAAHAAEAIDEPWSSEASRKLRIDLVQLGEEHGFSLLRTDCKTTSCAAALRWPSYHAAVEGFAALLHAGYEVDCARRITLPEPNDPDQPYDGTILFDCTAVRSPA
jgi:hypothetical protein